MVKLVTVVGAVTGTFHTGREMIVLKKGVEVEVSEAAAGWADERDLLADDAGEGEGEDADEAKAAIAALRAEYKTLKGQKAYGGWDAATLREKIAELKGDASDDADDGDDAGEGEGEGQAPA